MRLCTWAASLTLSLASVACARSIQPQLQVYLYPTPQSSTTAHARPPTLSYSQAKAVLSHHLKQDILDTEEIPENEEHWAHLMGLWDGNEWGKARVVVMDGVDAQDVLPSTIPSQPAFYLEDNTQSHRLLHPFMNEAKSLLAHTIESYPAFSKPFLDIFNLAGNAAQALSQELSCYIALVESLPWVEQTGKHSWETVSITGLRNVKRNSEIWETGRKIVQAGLETMTTPNSPPLLLVVRPASSKRIISRAAPTTLAFRANTTLAGSCYASNETCLEMTDCNGRGVCALASRNGEKECWSCKCRSGYAGVECQKDDYSMPFILLVFSTLLLLGIAGGSIALLYTIGETKLPSTLTLAVGGVMKHD
ncbi:uncharacterized protein L203_103442 [Cryptococcus depauperatus CBS 7841]|uniref:Vacuolar sorting protein Vps3844 C-terminal domain-containing protein n=1 Tax=Cryptococcus depauperatus CBS 7841 TaxID=1295531 RepID=A0A1E3IID1_9TREE|nr:hypothetical protein L203_02962 [Cryptococcus depauperatus CBS 7841]